MANNLPSFLALLCLMLWPRAWQPPSWDFLLQSVWEQMLDVMLFNWHFAGHGFSLCKVIIQVSSRLQGINGSLWIRQLREIIFSLLFRALRKCIFICQKYNILIVSRFYTVNTNGFGNHASGDFDDGFLRRKQRRNRTTFTLQQVSEEENIPMHTTVLILICIIILLYKVLFFTRHSACKVNARKHRATLIWQIHNLLEVNLF